MVEATTTAGTKFNVFLMYYIHLEAPYEQQINIFRLLFELIFAVF